MRRRIVLELGLREMTGRWEVSGVGDCVPPCWLESFVRVVFGQPWCSRSGNPVTVLEPLGMLLGPLK
jgi:hypothetical protein